MKNEIIKKANTQNYSKNDAHAAIIVLLNELNFDVLDKHRGDFAALYHQFIPKVPPSKPKSNFDWVGTAVSKKDENRPYLAYVYADGENLIATDYHRLHCVPDNLRKDKTLGFHDLKGNLIADQNMNFPNYKRIMDAQHKGADRFELPYFDSLEIVLEGKLQLVKLKDVYFQHRYLSALLGQVHSNWTATISKSQTVFEHGSGRSGVICNYRPKWERKDD